MLEKKPPPPPPLILKIVLIGDTQVGKTAILNRKVNKKFTAQPSLTEGMDFLPKKTRRKNTLLVRDTILLWDTVGQESRISGNAGFGETDAFVFVMDGTQPLTTISEHIQAQLKKAKEKSPDAKFYIAVNKVDQGIGGNLKITETVAESQIRERLQNLELSFLQEAPIFFCSAKKNKNIDQLFRRIEEDIIQYLTQDPSKIRPSHKSSIRKQLPLRSYVWRGGNILLALGSAALLVLSAFTVGSFLAFSILPFAFIGAFIITAAAFMVWNIGCKIYDVYSEMDRTLPLPLNKNKSKARRHKAKNKTPLPSTFGPEGVKIDTKKKPFKPASGLESTKISMSSIPSGTLVVYSSSEEDTAKPSIPQPNSSEDTSGQPVTNPSFTSVITQRQRARSAPLPPTKKMSSDPTNFHTDRMTPGAGLLFLPQQK